MENRQTPEEQEETRTRAELEAHLASLNRQWAAVHRKRARATNKQFLSAFPNATAVDKVLVRLAAHDTAIAELLGEAQVLLASRVVALLNNPKLVLTLTRGLSETTSCRNAAARRVEELLGTVTTMCAQRALVETKPKASHLRRVA
jgi:hypothetical protein